MLGLLLAVVAMPVSGNRTGADSVTKETSRAAGTTELEEKLQEILENVEGVGEVQVFLMTDEKKDIQGFGNSGTQQVTGVLICAQGGANPIVIKNIQEAVMALFQVDAHKIKIMKMK